jgi:hypothetical protein
VCVAALDGPLGSTFMDHVHLALRNKVAGEIWFNLSGQCRIISLPGPEIAPTIPRDSCYFPILIHESTIDELKEDDYHHGVYFDKYQNQADIASACALYQQQFFGIHLPVYQLLFEGNTTHVMRCWWEERGNDFAYFRTYPESPIRKEPAFDLTQPAEILELFLIIVNIMKHLPEIYGKSATKFREDVVSGEWIKNQRTKSYFAELNAEK